MRFLEMTWNDSFYIFIAFISLGKYQPRYWSRKQVFCECLNEHCIEVLGQTLDFIIYL